jgi:hypothetical protein
MMGIFMKEDDIFLPIIGRGTGHHSNNPRPAGRIKPSDPIACWSAMRPPNGLNVGQDIDRQLHGVARFGNSRQRAKKRIVTLKAKGIILNVFGRGTIKNELRRFGFVPSSFNRLRSDKKGTQ